VASTALEGCSESMLALVDWLDTFLEREDPLRFGINNVGSIRPAKEVDQKQASHYTLKHRTSREQTGTVQQAFQQTEFRVLIVIYRSDIKRSEPQSLLHCLLHSVNR
jgi:hypothetical protein